MRTPMLQTERMVLRPLLMTDAENIFNRWTSDERVTKYVRWSTHKSIYDTKDWLQMEISNIGSNKVYQWGFTLKDTGYLFGCGGIHINKNEGVFELGYNIMCDFWGHGYTTEAAKAIINFSYTELGQKDFVAWHAIENHASGAVMKKCGFVYEKNEVQTKFYGVTSFDTKFYKLTL